MRKVFMKQASPFSIFLLTHPTHTQICRESLYYIFFLINNFLLTYLIRLSSMRVKIKIEDTNNN